MTNHKHLWKETGKEGYHCTRDLVIYVRCEVCNQNGYRHKYKASSVIYTWSTDDIPPGDWES